MAETPQAAPALRVTTSAGPGTVPIRIAVSGSLVGRDEIAIRTPLQDQRIAAVLVEEGDWVRAGQPLATLETDTLDAQLRQAQATLGRARAQVQQQEALNAEAQTQLRRISPLVRSGSVSAQQIDQQQAQARSSAAALAAARAEQEQARAGWRRHRRNATRPRCWRRPTASCPSATRGPARGDAPLFKLIRDGLLELDGEVPKARWPASCPACPRGCGCPARRMRWPAAFAAYRPRWTRRRAWAVSGSRWRRRRRSGRAASPPRRWRPARTRCRSWCRSAR